MTGLFFIVQIVKKINPFAKVLIAVSGIMANFVE